MGTWCELALSLLLLLFAILDPSFVLMSHMMICLMISGDQQFIKCNVVCLFIICCFNCLFKLVNIITGIACYHLALQTCIMDMICIGR